MIPGQRPTISSSAQRAATQIVALGIGDEDMFGMIAAVLIVLWLLGSFAFHVTSSLIHIVLVAAVVLLILHFFTGRSATA